jgi:predicted HTH transcriptional regulator
VRFFLLFSYDSGIANAMDRQALINLRKALEYAEQDLGLSKLSANQKSLVYAAWEIADQNQNFTSDLLRQTALCETLPYATYHRSLAQLLSLGIFEKVAGTHRNKYKLCV